MKTTKSSLGRVNPMKRTMVSAALALVAAVLYVGDARSDGETTPGGVAAVYGHVAPDQVEFLSTPERIISVASSGGPSAIWEALEHGEKVECLECIPAVTPLLYNENSENREIAAWWLRRRIFGVFGAGEVYEQTLNTLKSDPSPQRRAYAASALGEFLAAPGIAACAAAITNDADAAVRASAALALGRLNDDGGGAIARALGDGDSRVKLAALTSIGRITGFADSGSVGNLLTDGDAKVRRRALEVLDGMYARDKVAGVINLAKSDPDADVRLAACHALGKFGDASAKSALESIAANDKDTFVRDQATIALRRL